MSAEVLRVAVQTIREEWGPERGSGWSAVQNFHLAVADWLDKIAGEGHEGDAPGGCDDCAPALTVARAYLGESA